MFYQIIMKINKLINKLCVLCTEYLLWVYDEIQSSSVEFSEKNGSPEFGLPGIACPKYNNRN